MAWEIVSDEEQFGRLLEPNNREITERDLPPQHRGGWENSAFMAAIEGFNRPFQSVAQGILNPFASDATRDRFRRERRDMRQASQGHPIASGIGEFVGSIGAGLPFGAAGTSAAMRLAPGANKYAQLAMGGGLGGALEGLVMHPGDSGSRGQNAIFGGIAGATLAPLLPLLGTALKGIGGFARRHVGGSQSAVLEDMLAKMTPEQLDEMFKSQMAAKSLGTHVTPAEASGSKLLTEFESKLGNADDTIMKMQEFRTGQKGKQKEIVEDLFERLNPSGDNFNRVGVEVAGDIIEQRRGALREKARPFYKAAERKRIGEKEFDKLMKDANINKAYNEVMGDESYRQANRFFGRDSVKVLDSVKKKMDTEVENLASTLAGQGKDPYKSKLISKSRDKLVEALDKSSKEYKKARKIYAEGMPDIEKRIEGDLGRVARLDESQQQNIGKILFDPQETDIKKFNKIRDDYLRYGEDGEGKDIWRGMLQNEMQRRLDTINHAATGNYGSNFFRNVLGKENNFKQIRSALRGDAKAQHKLDSMKRAFKNLINERTVKTAAGAAEGSMNKARASTQDAVSVLKKLTGDTYDKAIIKVITDPNYDKLFREALKKNQKNEQAKEFAKLLEKASSPALARAGVYETTKPYDYEIETDTGTYRGYR